MIIAVTAWRHWTDASFIRGQLGSWLGPFPLHIRVGDAPGGDEIVRDWCIEQRHRVSFTVFYADWERHGSHLGSPAGPIRNKEMLAGVRDPVTTDPTDLLLAFPGRQRPVRVPGSGSWGCCVEAALMGIRVEIPAYSAQAANG
jgi:hypothetical protein